MKKYFKYLLLVISAVLTFEISTNIVYADTAHKLSLRAYNCNKLNTSSQCVDDNGTVITPQALTNNSQIDVGKIIKLEIYYESGSPEVVSMQLGVDYDPNKFEPVHKNNSLLTQVKRKTSLDGGVWPPSPSSDPDDPYTDWTVQGNDYVNASSNQYQLRFLIKDPTLETTFSGSGVLVTTYVKVKEGLTPGDDLTLNYNNSYTKLTTYDLDLVQRTLSGINLKVYKELDTDPTLSDLTVTSGGTNYLTSFNKATKTYNVYVPNAVSSVVITGTPTKTSTVLTYSPSATNNTYSLNVSTTKTVTISTVAEDGTHTDTYTVNVYRLSNDNTLSSLSLSDISIGNFSSGTTTYTVTNPVPYATSSTTITATPTSNKATLNPTSGTVKNLSVGSNAITVVVTPECAKSAYSSVPNNTGTACQTKTYTVNVTRTSPSTNNYLSSLTVDGTSVPSFVKTNGGPYNLTVGYDTTKVNIAGTAEDSQFAVVSGQIGEQNLGVGDNTFVITVTPQDPDTAARNYSVKIYRKSNNANLGSLTVTSSPQGTLSPSSFSAGTTSYTYTVGPDVTEVNIAATKANSNQTSITGTGTYNPQTTSKVDIVVTAEDTTKSKTYTVNLVRNKSTDVTLDGLSVAGYTLSPSYSDSVNSYTVTVPSTVNSINVTATPHDSRTTATVSGKTTGLSTGDNTVTVTVTPEAGETAKRTITITVKKQASNANLSSLSLTNVSYTPSFAAGEISYSATVPYTTTQTKITAGLADSKASKTIKLNGTTISENTNVNLNVGTNTFTVLVKAEDTNVTKTYTVTVTRTAPSTNNYLSSLTVNSNSVPSFNKTNNGPYNVTVGYDTTKVTIAATAEDTEFATVTGDTGQKNVSVGDNTFEVTVTPQDPETLARTYTIIVHRKSNFADLGSLTVSSNPQGTLSPSTFSANTTSYTYTVGPDVTEVSIAATKGNSNQTSITGTGTYNPNDTTKVDILVKAEDDTKTKTYTVNLVRNKSTDVRLSELSVAGYTISPDYSDSVNTYNVTVPSNVSSVNVTATPIDSRTTASVSGNTNLQTGNNTVTVTVTPEAGETAKRTITINVKKLENNANLSGLTLTNVSYTPTFNSGEISYTANVPYTTDKTKITAGLASNKSTKAVTLNNVAIEENSDVNLAVGANTFKVVVSPECAGSTYSTVPGNSGNACQAKTYTVVVNRAAASGDAYLTDLTIGGATVEGFDGENTFSYNVTVGSNVSSITIGATPNSTSVLADSSDIGTKNLSVGMNDFEIVVVAQNGSTRVPYQLHVKKLNGDNELSGLSITSSPSGTQEPSSFNKQTTSYTYTVGPDVTAVTINATVPTGATLTYSPTATNNIYNPNNTNVVTITVDPEDPAVAEKTYTVNLARIESSVNTLSGITVNGTSVSGFDPATTSYSVTVPYDTPTVTVAATPADGDREQVTVTPPTTYGVGDNVYTIAVEAEDGTPNTYTVTVHRKNNDATLSSLTLDNVTFNETFDPDITEYTATVPYTTTTTNVNATPADTSLDPNTNVIITGDTSLSVGNSNVFTITVTPEDINEPSKTYTVTVTREAASTEAYLTGITVNGTAIEGFDKDTDTYTVNIANSVTEANIIGTANTNSTVSGNGNKTNLVIGDNGPYTITAVAQDGTTTKPYYVTIHRKDTNNNLSGLTITADPAGSLDTQFDPDTTEYTYTVGPDTPTITVTGTPAGNAQVTGDGEFDPTTTDKIEVVVTPEEGEPKTYTINVVRNKSTDVTLDELSVAEGTITPSYADDVDSYSVTVSSDVDQVNVTATPHDPRTNASVSGNTNLQTGDNPVTVTVTPESGDADKRLITINVHKKNTDATLSSLSLDNVTLEPNFDPGITTYTATVPYTTTETAVNATPSDTSRTPVIVGDTNLGVGENTFTITVTPEEGEPVTYEVKVTREDPSSEVYLTGITVNGTAIEGFDKDTDTYTVDIANSITEAEIIGTANTNSTVEGNGTKTNLTVGDNGPYTITSKAQDGTTTKPYYVTIHRKDNNNKLSGLVITADPAGTLDTAFDPDITEYIYTVGPDTPAITVTGTPAGGATVTGDGTFDPTTTDKIEVVVTPEDGTPQTYTINVVRNKSTNADLLNLGIENYTISPSFDKDEILYTLTVENEITKVNVIGEKGDSRQTIDGLGEKDLTVGDNPLQVVVTPEDTTATPKTYTIVVTRKPNTNNYLSSLTVANMTLNESFNKENQAYTLTVPASTTSINVSATPEVNTSSVSGTGEWQLTGDTTEVKVTVTSQAQVGRDYIITVTKADDTEFITSLVYGHTIADGMIKTVTYKTKPNELKDQLDNENAKLHIYTTNASVDEVDDNLRLGTGYIVKLINNGVLKDSKLIVVKGDVDGDGVATLFDTVKILNHYLEKEILTGPYFEAADVDSDGEITLFDAVEALKIYLNDSE